jgi:hypothetical protein
MVFADWIAWGAVAALIGLRFVWWRRRRTRGTPLWRLWVGPALLATASVAVLVAFPPGSWLHAVALVGALATGAALGLLRGWVTPVQFDERSGRITTRMTFAMVPAFAGVMALRMAARYGLRSGAIAGVAAVSMSATALLLLGMVTARQTLLYVKARRLRDGVGRGMDDGVELA